MPASTTVRAGSGSKAAPASPSQASMKFEKARPDMVAFFDAVMPGPERGVEKRQMFGAPVRFANGNMCMGLHNNRIVLRLSEADRGSFLKLPGASIFEPMPGRPMKEYVSVPEPLLRREAELKHWIERSLAYAAGLPAKKKRAKA